MVITWVKVQNSKKPELSKFKNLNLLYAYKVLTRTSDGGNGIHSVSLPIILIKIKVDQMLPSSYISSLLVSIL